MQITRFVGAKIHGYIDHDIKFQKDLTFLTGINGCGKTSVLNAISALITPSIQVLAELEYEKISIYFSHDGKKYTISSLKEGSEVSISCSSEESSLQYRKYIAGTDVLPYKAAEQEAEYYREITIRLSQLSLYRFILSLPTPMFLGLDRRYRGGEETLRSRRFRVTRGSRNIFSGTLSGSLLDATALAEDKIRDNLIEIGKASEQLRSNILLGLLAVDVRRMPIDSLRIPTKGDVQEIERMKRELQSLSRILLLPEESVRDSLGGFLDSLSSDASVIPTGVKPEAIFGPRTSIMADNPIRDAVLRWSVNWPQIQRIKSIKRLLDDYNRKTEAIKENADRYLRIINRFHADSGKCVEFDDRGYLSFALDGAKKGCDITTLSSGEAQIFVILTHLFFNPDVQGGNVFIIDEPELSLHVQWQEHFVESLLEANAKVQYIFATHSPSIILDKTKNCVDLSRRKRK